MMWFSITVITNVILLWQVVGGQTTCTRTRRQQNRITNSIFDKINEFRDNNFEILEGSACNHRYLFSKFSVDSSSDGQRICNAYGGYLAEVDDEEEFNRLKGFQFSFEGANRRVPECFFLGGSDEANERTWVSTRTGDALTYFQWRRREPSGGPEDCLSLCSFNRTPLEMNDIHCFLPNARYLRRILCEIPYTEGSTPKEGSLGVCSRTDSGFVPTPRALS